MLWRCAAMPGAAETIDSGSTPPVAEARRVAEALTLPH